MRISDWSSDVCSSDLPSAPETRPASGRHAARALGAQSWLPLRQPGITMRLRTRLVLWFVAAIIVTVLMSFTLGSQVWRLFYNDYDAGQDAHAAVLVWQKGGDRELRHWLREQRRDDGIFRMLLDENGESLSGRDGPPPPRRSEEHTSELQSLMRTSYAVFGLNKKKIAVKNPRQ